MFRKVNILGMELDEWQVESCTAHFGVGNDWATLTDIESTIPSQGHATKLLTIAKAYYEKQGKRVGGSIALNERMARLYRKVGYIEYD